MTRTNTNTNCARQRASERFVMVVRACAVVSFTEKH